MTNSFKFYLSSLFIVLLSALILFFNLSDLPGLHGDEAWVILRSFKEINRGIFPIQGMNFYTGSLHQIIVTPFLNLFGFNQLTLRSVGVSLNIISLFILMRMIFIMTEEYILSLAAGLVIMTLPAFILNSRIGVEVLALNPFLTICGFYLLQKAHLNSKLKIQIIFGSMAGLSFSLAIYSHAVSLFLILGICLSIFILYPTKTIKSIAGWSALIPGLTFLLFTMIKRGWFSHIESISHKNLSGVSSSHNWNDVFHLPILLQRMIEGSALFLRYTGVNAHPYFAWNIFLYFLLLIFAWVYRSKTFYQKNYWILPLGLFLGAIITTLLSPSAGLNYFHTLIILTPIPFIIFAKDLFLSKKMLSYLCLTIIISAQSLNVIQNYFLQFQHHGIQNNVFEFGARLHETSGHFLSVKTVFTQLKDKNITTVYADPLTLWPLEVLSLQEGYPIKTHAVFRWKRLKEKLTPKNSAYITYNSRLSISGHDADPPDTTTLASKNATFKKIKSFDPKFLFYILSDSKP